MVMFIGRKDELEQLEALYGSPNVRTCAIYGRRRIGKTALIKQFCEGKRHVFLTAPGKTRDITMEAFRAVLSNFSGQEAGGVTDIHSFLDHLRGLASDERTVVVIDEFPNLALMFPEAPDLLQVFIDHDLDRCNIFLIVCGSSISAMGQHLNDGDSPLFKRFLNQIRLMPLPYRDARLFHDGLPEEDRIRAYAIASGIPAYHEAMAGMQVERAIRTLFLGTVATLRDEVDSLASIELKPRQVYDPILSSIHGSQSDITSITSSSGVDRTTCQKAVDNLVLLGIVRKDIPYRKVRKSAYTISDGFVRFHYDVLSRGEMTVQYADSRDLYRALSTYIQTFYGGRFEDLCREYVASNYVCRWIGRWWGAVPVKRDGRIVRDENGKVQTEDTDVDIVAEVVNGDNVDLMLCECKFTGKVVGVREFRLLVERGETVRRGGDNKRYVMFSRSGFTPELEDLASDGSEFRLELVGIPEIEAWAERADGDEM